MRRAAIATSVMIACGSPRPGAPDASGGDDAARPHAKVTITATVGSTRFVTREHMLASGEMQISGEPLAEAMGRTLAGFSRDRLPTDLYFDVDFNTSWIDLAGFSTGVESYEYSKQPMNLLAFESGAGTSLMYAPRFAQAGAFAARVQHFAAGSNALGRFVSAPSADDPLGWRGLWPTAHVFASFDPASDPTGAMDRDCRISSDDDPDGAAVNRIICADYECDATTLHLRDRAAQIERVITPGADGFSGWKYGLWTINYLQAMHDTSTAAVASVRDDVLAQVGHAGNVIVGDDGQGGATAAGTWLGSSDIEGFQAQLFVEMLDARADDWLARLTTADGASLSGFASVGDALRYDEVAPLRWWPASIAVSETAVAGGPPRATFAVTSADSALLDLLGMTLAYAELFALTDVRNPDIGGAQPARAIFDGDPFAADDPAVDGDATPHDRALAMLRVALVDLDRLHVDPGSGLLVDDVAMHGAAPARGHALSTMSAAYAVIALRTALRALDAQLGLYSNNTPDTAITRTPLDAFPLHAPGGASTLSARVEQIVRAHAALLYDHLTTPAGRAFDGWDVAAGAPVSDADHLDAHAAAIRGLFAAYLATGDVRYRDRAMAVFARMQAVFYDEDARVWSDVPAPVDQVTYTPVRFALVQSALRDVYELVAARPGGEPLAPVIEEHLARLDTLVLNGWDDRDHDRLVAWPDECVNVVDGLPRGGLQMAERTLTGEIGSLKAETQPGQPRTPTADREHDCVPEIDDAHLPAALAAEVTFHLEREPLP